MFAGGLIRDSFVVSLAGALLSLDRTAAFQTMVSRPIVAAPVAGYLLGNPWIGLVAGIALELLFIGDLPVGVYLPVHETGLSVLVTSMAVTAMKASGSQAYAGEGGSLIQGMLLVPSVMLVALPASWLFQKADFVTRGFNIRLFRHLEASIEAGAPVSVVRANLKGLAVFFTAAFVAILAAALPLNAAAFALSRVYAPGEMMLASFAGCLVLGLASAYSALDTARGVFIFASSGILATALWVLAM